MAQTHEIRLKIDAEAADAGAKQFSAAISAIKAAVAGLARDTDGAFTSLSKIKAPKVDTSGLASAKREADGATASVNKFDAAAAKAGDGLRRLALASSAAWRTSEAQAARLVSRLGDIGDTTGIARIQSQLAGLKGSLAGATSLLGVREARSAYSDLANELNIVAGRAQDAKFAVSQAGVADLDAANAARIHAAELDTLRAKYNPLYSASKQYETAVREIARAEEIGAVSSKAATDARQRATASLRAASTTADSYSASLGRNAGATQQGIMASQQFSDILITSQMGFQSLSTIVLQQGSQLAAQMQGIKSSGQSVFRTLLTGVTSLINPLSLLTLGVVAVAAITAKWAFSASAAADEVKPLAEYMSNLDSATSKLTNSITAQVTPVSELQAKYGGLADELQRNLELQTKLDAVSAKKSVTETIGVVTAPISFGTTETSSSTLANLSSEYESIRNRLAEIKVLMADMTAGSAGADSILAEKLSLEARLSGSLNSLEVFKMRIDSIATAFKITTAQAEQLVIAQARLRESSGPRQQLENVRALETLMLSVFGSAEAANSATDGMFESLVGVERKAADVVNELGKIPSKASVSVVMSQDMASFLRDSAAAAAAVSAANMAGNIGSALGPAAQLAATLWDAAAAMVAGRIAGAAVKRIPGGIDAIGSGDLNWSGGNWTRRVPVKPIETGGATSGGSSRAADLDTESGRLAKLQETMADRNRSLGEENAALRLLSTGQAATKEGAELMAAAMAQSGGVMDAATQSTITLHDAQARLQKELTKNAANPLGDYLDSLPTALSATRQASADMATTLRDGLTSVFMGEGLDAGALVDTLRRSIATGLSGVLTGKLLGSLGIDPSGVAAGARVGSTIMGGGIVAASAQGASMFAAAISGASIPAAVGGAGAGIFGGIGSWITKLFGFSEGGHSDRASPHPMAVSPMSFVNAPHFASGTANTSGIPAILHDNEAVIPLSRGRKIPVDLSGVETGGGGGGVVFGDTTNNINIEMQGGTDDPAEAAKAAGQIAQLIQASVAQQMAAQLAYGGMFNPRGR